MMRLTYFAIFVCIMLFALPVYGVDCPTGDVDGDCMVGIEDLVIMAGQWLESGIIPANLDGQGNVDGDDFSILAGDWGETGPTGTLTVTISPQEAIDAGGQWRVDEGVWHDSGDEISLKLDIYMVEFSLVSGLQNPAPVEVEIFADTLASVNRTYTPIQNITLQINEFMASNDITVSDPEGQFDDWFEIYNSTGSPVEMGGMYVADNANMWQIPTGDPATIIPAGGYLLFWADNDTPDGALHVGLQLNADGDWLALYNTDGLTLIDSVTIGAQISDVSYGRYLDGGADFFYFNAASPGTSNDTQETFAGQVEDTKFSHNRGFYDASFAVTITTDTPGATIYYTLDDGASPINPDGTPTSTAITYSGPVSVTTTKSLRAAAVKTGWLPTNIDTQSYIFLNDVLQQDGTGLLPHELWGERGNPDWEMDPTVIDDEPFTDDDGLSFDVKDALMAAPTLALTMNWDDWFGEAGSPTGQGIYVDDEGDERVCSAELISPDGSEDGFQVNCTVQIVGGSSPSRTLGGSWKMDKLSMRLKFRPRLDDGTPTGGPGRLNYDLFADTKVDSFNTIVLDARMNLSWAYSGGSSPAYQQLHAQYTRDQFPCDIQNTMGGYAPHGRPVHLYLNDVYWGMYLIHERPDAAFAASYFGGEKDDYDVIKHDPGLSHVVGYDDDPVAKQLAADNYDDLSYAANQSLSDTGNYLAVLDLLDVEDFIDYMIMNFYIGNMDWSQHNWYASRSRVDAGGLWRYHSWDAEKCLQEIGHSRTTRNDGDGSPTGLHRDLRANDDYRRLFGDHVHKHFFNDGLLTPVAIAQLYQKQLDQIDRVVVAESVRWGDNMEFNYYDPSGITYTRDVHWIAERDRLLNDYFPQRTAEVLEQLKNDGMYPDTEAPVFNIGGSYQHGGYVAPGDNLTMDNPNAGGTIYYTLDGTDPLVLSGDMSMTLVDESDAKMVLVPTSDIGSDWYSQPGYNDAGWTSGSGGVGFDTKNDYNDYFDIDVEGVMHDINSTCYIRIPFTVDDADDVASLILKIRYDDGFIAYLNGTKIAEANPTGDNPPQWDSGASDSHSDSEAIVFEGFDVSAYIGELVDGDNLLAIHGLNSSSGNSDFLISAELVEAAVSPSAIEYTGPVELNLSSTAKARVLSGASWSALNEAVFAVGPVLESLRITELMYHPTDPTAGEIAALNPDPIDEDFEFIELKNIGGAAINLNLVHFTDGIDFTFGDYTLAAGEYAVLVRNQTAFVTRYGTSGINIVPGSYTGSLDNGGEEIVLRDAVGTEIHDFDYNDSWYDITDGGGFSLTIKDPASSNLNLWDEKAGWRPSAAVNGSPGGDDTGDVPEPGAIVINEVLAHSHLTAPDWIELHNTTGSPIDIGNWYLSDNDNDLTKYKIASGTTIAAGGYIVFTQDVHFGSEFGLSENGETVYLHSGDGSGITGYSAEEAFGASETNVAFGRYEKSTGAFNFVAMSANTPGASYEGAPNAYPKVGPIVINEIMYHPTDAGGDAEYIELKNISGSPVTLYDNDPLVLEPWKITDGIEYTFPSGSPVTIGAGGYYLLIKDLGAFTDEYGAPAAGKYAVWTDGGLSNGGEKVEISMPGDVDGDDVRQYIRIDRVNYSDGSHPVGDDPWPVGADGDGMGLSRKVSADYGNDVANWRAVSKTPGVENVVPSVPTVINAVATNITFSSATLNGEVTDNGGEGPTVTIYWGDNDGGTTPGNWDNAETIGTQNSTFIDNISSLSASTTYYFRAYALNSEGGDWANSTASFVTDSGPSIPTVVNAAATNITFYSATLNGEVTDNGDEDPTVTIYWGDNDGGTNPGSWDNAEIIGTQNSTFINDLSSLSESTTYYFRSYALNSAGGDWADSTASFATTAAPEGLLYINFQSESATVPGGYLKDYGQVYGVQDNGYTYGWSADAIADGRDRGTHPDRRWDTLVHMSKGSPKTWEIALDNGQYVIDLVAGDATNIDQINSLLVEGVFLEDPDGEDNFDEYYGIAVTVNDGKLTIEEGPGAINPKLCYIDIAMIVPSAPTVINLAATNITSDSARLNGEVTDNGNEDPTVTIYWGDNDGGTTPGNWDNADTIGTQNSTFINYISSLSASTTYYFRAYASNSAGSDWADSTASFITDPVGVVDVEIIGTWTTGLYHTAESGSNRVLIFTAHCQDNDSAGSYLDSVTYGGQSLTRIEDEEFFASPYHYYVAAWYLDEAGIAAASGSSFSVTWSDGVPYNVPDNAPGYSSVFLANVDQATPIGASAANNCDCEILSTSSLATNDGDMVLLTAFHGGNSASGTDYEILNSFTEERPDFYNPPNSGEGMGGYKAATGANETPSVDSQNNDYSGRQALIGFVVRKD